jgi:hypothetical protein
MAFKSVLYFPRVSVENLDILVIVGAVYCREELTSVRELDFFASFEWDFFVVFYLVVVKDYAHHF